MWAFVVLIVFISLIIKSVRYYIYSFFFSFLYNRSYIANKILCIKYVDDITFRPERGDVQIYLTGVFAKLFSWFTGLPIITPVETRKELMHLQGLYAKNISMESYLEPIINKHMTLNEFEDFLAECILTETNRVFNILNPIEEKIICRQLKCIRTVLSGLTGGENRSIFQFIKGLSAIRQVTKILHNHTPSQRLLILIPCLSLIDGISKMLVQNDKDIGTRTKELEMKDFFDYTSKFFVVLYKGDLTFINRTKDDSNTITNRAFGVPRGFLCPGSLYVTKFIKSILEFLRCLDITIEGDAIISTGRFRTITNKKDMSLTFKIHEHNTYDATRTEHLNMDDIYVS